MSQTCETRCEDCYKYTRSVKLLEMDRGVWGLSITIYRVVAAPAAKSAAAADDDCGAAGGGSGGICLKRALYVSRVCCVCVWVMSHDGVSNTK